MYLIVLSYLVPVLLWFIAVALWRFWVRSTRDKDCPLPLPPGCAGYPFVGETLNMLWKKFEFYREKRRRYGRVYMTHMLGAPTVRVWGNENLKKVLRGEETIVTMRWPKSCVKLLGPGALVNSSRRLHTKRRQALSKAFTLKNLDGFAPGVHKIVSRYLQSWCQQGSMNLKQETSQLSFESILRMIVGFDFSHELMLSMLGHLGHITEAFFSLPIDLPGTSLRKGMNARKLFMKDMDEILKHKTPCNTDLASILLHSSHDGKKLSADEVKDEVLEMLFSGYQGMASLMVSAIMQLFKHPEVSSKLLEELRDNKMLGGELKMEQMNRLPYLKQVVLELLRFGAPFGGGFRTVLKTFELEGYQIPKGWKVLYSIRDNHESEENYSKAMHFNPDRWDKLNTDCPEEDYMIMTFGGPGIRSCIGAKFVILALQLFLCEMVRSTQWSLTEPDPEMSYFPTMMPKPDLRVDFVSESKSRQFSSNGRIDAGDKKPSLL